ncbi:T9SS type A sorting domain-containing protein [Aequorivita todarodis]|uniref:T9SS type A sorting domain-containing protein n=1 Tax=Aequorivita todarodis TaxID=2036821 RepID=UPI0023507CF4|nr:T9SS type A sorting domain-containing protein [Aequorivita todarodis]MDC8000389.1 T9SS type A sorting domain-containing protein [Aequorivita todarodis]
MKYFLLTAMCLFYIVAYSQFGPQQIITQTANGSKWIIATDIDGDGYKDVASANEFGSNLTWYKNLDGHGTFGPENIIANLNQTFFISDADIDGDDDMDVMAVSFAQDKIVWYENLDGQGNFSGQNIVSHTADGAYAVVAGDLDGDGDLDLIAAIDLAGTVAWYENLDGLGNFSTIKIIDNTIGSPQFVSVADMDGDGDLDVVGNGTGTSKAYWIENMNGIGSFGTRHVINNAGAYLNVVIPADADGDGDMDAFSASPFDKEVAWYENLDGLGNFGPKSTITDTLENAWTVFAADLDNDGDMDVLATSVETFGGEIVWFENLDGQGNFSSKKIISTEVQSPRSVLAADIDNDGDMDVIASSQNDDKIAWYENYTILSVEENKINSLTVYPNPTKGLIYINPKTKTIISIGVFDLLGKKVLQLEGNIQRIDISTLQSGMYFLRIVTEVGDFVHKIIKE